MAQAVLAVLAGVGLAMLVGSLDRASAEVTEQHVKEASERKEVAPEAILSHPLDCDAWVMHSGTPGELPRARCYVRKGAQ